MYFIVDTLKELNVDVYLGLFSSDKTEDSAPFVVSRALGRTFCTDKKVVVVLSYLGFIKALPNLMDAGILSRRNFFVIITIPSLGARNHIKVRSIAYGLGFSAFKLTASYTCSDVDKFIRDILPKVNGPVCIFIEESSING